MRSPRSTSSRPSFLESCGSIAPNGGPTTIYHFAYSPEEGRCLGFAYRSTNDFESEELQSNALGIKPSENVEDKAEQAIERSGIVGGMVELINLAKEVDDAKPTGERVGVGGALCAAFITRDGMRTSEVYRFPDYEDLYSEMVLGLQ